MALLPKIKEQMRISDLRIGESCYCVPYAMKVRSDGKCFLDVYYNAHKEPTDSARLKIERIDNGFIAYIYDVIYQWAKKDSEDDNDFFSYKEVVGFGSVSYAEMSEQELQTLMDEAAENQEYELAEKIRIHICGRKYRISKM